MKFENEDGIIYCEYLYCKKCDNSTFYYHIKYNSLFYKGYLLHRKDGPAIVWTNNAKRCWYINGKRHREDGPAIEYDDGDKYWYLNDIIYSEQEYLTIINLKNKNRVLDEI